MNTPPIVSPLEWKVAREELLVEEKELTTPVMRWPPSAAGCREWPWISSTDSRARTAPRACPTFSRDAVS